MKTYIKTFNQLRSLLNEITSISKEVTKPFKPETGLALIKLP